MSEEADLLQAWAAQAVSLSARIRADEDRDRAWAYEEAAARSARGTRGGGGSGRGGGRRAGFGSGTAPARSPMARAPSSPRSGASPGAPASEPGPGAGSGVQARAAPAGSRGGGAGFTRTGPGPGPGVRSPAGGGAGLVARGYAPAVVKVVSYASGPARAKATAQYVLREDVEIETHDGRALTSREAVNAEIAAWSGRFGKREPTQDVIGVRVGILGLRDEAGDRGQLRRAVEAGFAGHRYAYRLEAGPDGSIGAQVVVVAAGQGRERFKVAGQRIGDEAAGFERRILDPASEARIKARMEAATGAGQHRMRLEPSAPGHGVEAVRHRLGQLVAGGPAVAEDGRAVGDAAAVQALARSWQPHLRSQRARDTMHLVVSARAGTDRQAFRDAVRDFLGDTFSDHTFVFGVHTDTEGSGHIHAHAVVAVRGLSGPKINPGVQDLRRWRQAYAEHAQAQGLQIVATTAQERASSQSYGRRDKAIVAAADHPRPGREARDRAYANHLENQEMIANARARMARARANPIRVPVGAQALERTASVARVWGDLAGSEPENAVAAAYARRAQEAHRLGARALGQGLAPASDQGGSLDGHRAGSAAVAPSPAATGSELGAGLRRLGAAVSGTVAAAEARVRGRPAPATTQAQAATAATAAGSRGTAPVARASEAAELPGATTASVGRDRRASEADRSAASQSAPEGDRTGAPAAPAVAPAAALARSGAAAEMPEPPRGSRVTAARMEADLAAMTRSAAAMAAQLTGAERARYEEGTARVLRASAAKLDLQRLREAGYTHIDVATARALLPADRADAILAAARQEQAQTPAQTPTRGTTQGRTAQAQAQAEGQAAGAPEARQAQPSAQTRSAAAGGTDHATAVRAGETEDDRRRRVLEQIRANRLQRERQAEDEQEM